MSRRSWRITLCVLIVAAVAVYAYRWFTPNSAADLARTGRCEEYRQAEKRLEAGLESETAADPAEVQMVLDECERQGH